MIQQPIQVRCQFLKLAVRVWCNLCPCALMHAVNNMHATLCSGSWMKREGRPKDSDILTSRLIDRPIRPMMPKGYTHDTQILAYTLSYDGVHTPEPHAITCASAAMLLSGMHFHMAACSLH